MPSVSIVNVTSYTGLELLRLLSQHPQFVVTSVTGRSAVGKRLDEVFPQLSSLLAFNQAATPAVNPKLVIGEEPAQTDLAFVCLPHAAAAEMVAHLLKRGTRVVDLSADFRLYDVAVYEEWYKHVHPAPALIEDAVYGLCERYRERIRKSSLVANPGCHSSTAILGLLPAFAAGIINPDVIIDSKTGISGAGRSPSLKTHYAEVNEDMSAYSLEGHRHLAEIVQELIAGAKDGGHPLSAPPRITFIPHLAPMTRGILATCYADLKPDAQQRMPTTAEIRALYEEYYANEPFVHVVDQPPHTKWTYGSNHCFIYPVVDVRTQRLIVISCLDNLVKGASGQAVQNANLLYGYPETMGLSIVGVNP
ncbi:N-acetyl-gamma-glutamyl-phosphate reductase [Ktedonosporobacter rubrisoli]|uniref:N-acetyl-gamma-glutamyl-phosphate reductase n=1 Tax=Ktedonosporobacter rubrisoli TaxID=2509675 RepID=A0A4P6JRL4_KTERU|nr:N-acetyl-gamma-glutamyl-phosphate reductase [Ktedonosporobacter rubrisoli]QBD77935.1 N-acetyl-gamma-glutamyl-phosphate reductase [Ktedonosporobacter rubrisoli]